jgi:ATP-dependent Zn protease
MAQPGRSLSLPSQQDSAELARQWRTLTRAATFVALLTSPAAYVYLHKQLGWSVGWSIFGAIGIVAAFRGFIDLVLRRFIPWPTMFGVEDRQLQDDDVVNRRRAWFWRFWYRIVAFILILITIVWVKRLLFGPGGTWWDAANATWTWVDNTIHNPQLSGYLIILPFLFLINFLILFGPLVFMGISQIRGFEPGDADWGVRLNDVRGQKEAKEEVRRIVSLWQSGELFEEAGGKRERGLLFLGAPGTGKTMLAKAIATGFNSPFVSIPGSGFAQAQPLDAKILTPRGWTTMGAIGIGDDVVDPAGGTARVIGVFPQGERDIYRVTFSDGSSTECDLDHLWQIRRDRRRPWRIETLQTIKEKLESDSRQNRPYIPLVENLEFEEHELPLDPYLLGVLLGDGCFTTTTPSLIAAEPELVGAAAARLPSGMSAAENSGKSGAYYLTSGHRGRLPNPLTSTLKSLGLYGHGALTKFVPDIYKYASSETRLEVLRGLMDTDGYVRQDERSEAVFATSSPALAGDVVFLARSLGGTATKRRIGTYRHPVHGERPAAPGWQVSVALGPDTNPFRLDRKSDCWTRAWEPSRRMVSIEKVGRKQAQCIKLDSENELYVTDDFVVTHNTFIGMDVVIVRWLARKAKKLAAKWGGQCIVFIDEIDAVGMRRSSLGGAQGSFAPTNLEDFLFYGPNGALNPTGDMILETRAWRERLFNERAPERRSPYPPFVQKLASIVNQGAMPGMFGGGGQLALNQLLIVMDGVDNPPFTRRVLTNKVNGLLDASYVIPSRIGKVRLRLPTPKPRKEQIYFIGATNVPIDNLDPALTRPGRMGRHVWFRTPTKQDRLDIFDLYITKVAHDPELDRPERRDEMARITMGYSPAMIEQVCSLALTYAHHQGHPAFDWDDLVEAMTTLESGTAIGIDYIPEETRAVAIHEAGHAVAGHVYMKGRESTRLSIRMRGGSLGHHQAMEREERFSRFRSEEIGLLVWGIGAMAAERVFYGENSNGVGGDLMSTTAAAAWMVGASGMGPEPLEINGSIGYRQNGTSRRLTAQEQRDEIMKRFEEIGLQLMNRTGSGPMDHNPIGAVLSDPYKRKTVAQILGQAYIKAHHLIEHNKSQVERIAEEVIAKKELYGNDLVRLLDGAKLEIPQVDLTKESSWPTL